MLPFLSYLIDYRRFLGQPIPFSNGVREEGVFVRICSSVYHQSAPKAHPMINYDDDVVCWNHFTNGWTNFFIRVLNFFPTKLHQSLQAK